MKAVNFPASHCPKCSHKLNFYHNVPLFSWLFLGGKCAFCKQKISLVYPLVELVSGLLFLICFFKECGEIFEHRNLALYAIFRALLYHATSP
ncbi:prepilin peptidase [Campylobacter concisus]